MNKLHKTIICTAAALLIAIPLVGTSITPAPAAEAANKQKASFEAGLGHTPFKKAGVTYLPLKDVAELLDLQVKWNTQTRKTEITGITQYAELTPGKPVIMIKGTKRLTLNAAPLVKSGVTYVPEALFSKAFSIPVKWKTKEFVTLPYEKKYTMNSLGNKLFWLNKSADVLYSGTSGQLPVRSGTISSRELDWMDMKIRNAGGETYVLDINNSYGEPHIHDEWIRVILYKGKIVKQAQMSLEAAGMNPDFYGYIYPNAASYKGNIVMNTGHRMELVTPQGQVVESFNLDRIAGTTKDVYSVETLEAEFLLIRQHRTGDLMLVNRATGESSVLYKQLFDKETATKIEKQTPDYYRYRLTYAGRSGKTLKFNWGLEGQKNGQTLTMELPF
ncbi:copper amine oxidase N-terminal domain-containing protein [Paenibacillus sp. CAA11]|uniref:copper amine oxidase N-terminal domain-containing protein n=1 Tax=Paenibacillus sp. CAA11 TaxID=1532905 RepID=UPI00131EFCF3|nr:copper amine oxidase N-terminal domain-containing protein [Paenibacillus sp. CAA11]